MKPLVSVVVPFYNEEDNITILAERIDAVFAELSEYEYECLFVNDGSTDRTHAVLDELATVNRHVLPVHLSTNRGQSAAVIAGFRRAQGDYLLMLDGDLQNDPADFPEMLRLLQQHDCVCGYRADRQDSRMRMISSAVANRVRALFVPTGSRDAGCGNKGFVKACVPHLVLFNGAHRFLDSIIANAGFSIVECPVRHHARQHGVSKYGISNRLWRGLYDLIGVRWLCRRTVVYEIEGSEANV